MSSRIDLVSRSMTQFLGQDSAAAKQVPVIADGENSFGSTLKRAINEVSDSQDRTADITQKFLAGDKNVELHQVMAATEESGIAMDLLIELRNKTVEAYRSVINMQS